MGFPFVKRTLRKENSSQRERCAKGLKSGGFQVSKFFWNFFVEFLRFHPEGHI